MLHRAVAMATRSYGVLVFLLLPLVLCLAAPEEEDFRIEELFLQRSRGIDAQGPHFPDEGTSTVDTPKDDPQRLLPEGPPSPSEVPVLTSFSAAPPEAAASEESPVARDSVKGVTTESYEQTLVSIDLTSTTPPSVLSTPTPVSVGPTPDVPVAQEIECFRKCPKMEGHLPVCATNGLTYANLQTFLCVKRCYLPDINLAHFFDCDSRKPKKSKISEGESFWRRRRNHHHRHYALDAESSSPEK
ncbi:uncharacterized protein LOC143020669 [Oratosquilla oratoria]|uniref:uncharacterized protein LOC143020669 n=1 Tax=Oratosquilla oratoria TaxID=337810 RepID=UPI003F76BB63